MQNSFILEDNVVIGNISKIQDMNALPWAEPSNSSGAR